MNNKKETYSHFLQKALVKHFARMGIIKWMKYPNGKIGTFNINSYNSKQPIARKGYYSSHIEIGMNNLENEGIKVIRKIAKNAQFEKEISLNRRELITLKFYSLLSSTRTQKLRNHILNRTGDSVFNSMVDSTSDSPKEIQEKMISALLKYWKENKKGLIGNIFQDTFKKKDDKVLHSCLINISNYMNSRLLIFKFKSSNLLLTEALNFTEQNKQSGGILLTFMPIFSNVGIAFYFDPVIMRDTKITKQKSIIFENDISRARHKTKYINWEIMREKQIEYLRNSKNLDMDNTKFWTFEASKYHHKDDKYIYEVLEETKYVASFCNAMALAHCKDSYVIFQNQKDIEDAEKIIKIKSIYRIEDYT